MSDTLIANPQASPTGGQNSADPTSATQPQQAPPSGDGQTPGQQPNAGAAATQQDAGGNPSQSAQGQPAQQEIELKLPEGSSLDATYLEKTKAMAKDLGLTQEAAQKLVERDNAMMAGFVEQHQVKWNEQVVQWEGAVKSDKEIGGANFQSSVHDARTALDKFGTPEFKNMLNQSGYGNHPELIRLLSRVGKAMREDKMVTTSSQPSRTYKSFADAFYPSMANKSE
jgi:hypothetical protein